VIVTHRAQCLRAVDKILVLRDGVQVAFGSSNEILKLAGRAPPSPMRARIVPINMENRARAE
jgi:ABC-type protease/lipase transport system fused ATPase/permease subunit